MSTGKIRPDPRGDGLDICFPPGVVASETEGTSLASTHASAMIDSGETPSFFRRFAGKKFPTSKVTTIAFVTQHIGSVVRHSER